VGKIPLILSTGLRHCPLAACQSAYIDCMSRGRALRDNLVSRDIDIGNGVMDQAGVERKFPSDTAAHSPSGYPLSD
jgi:hypothetical protein